MVFACALSAASAAFSSPLAKPQAECYRIEVRFEPERGFLRAKATLTLRADKPTDAVELELNPGLEIRGITNGQGRELRFDRGRAIGSLRFLIHLAEPAKGEFSFHIAYEGAPLFPPNRLDSISKDGILLRDDALWYPVIDLFAFARNDITIELPAGWTAFTSGKGETEPRSGRSSIQHFRTEHPVSSRSLFAAPAASPTGPCSGGGAVAGGAAATNGGLEAPKSVNGSVCYTGQNPKNGGLLAEKAYDVMMRFRRRLGALPDDSLQIVQGFPGRRGAVGYSAPNLLVVSPDFVRDFGYPGYQPEFLPHEIAHQWFPSEVTLASEADGWLAESLAEYLADRSLEEDDPPAAQRLIERAMRDALSPDPLRPLSLGLRLFDLENWEVTYATLYQRGMLVFRTLESVMGREQLDRALRELYGRKAGSSASLADFRRICEEVSGHELGWFFEYFLNGTRVPELALRPAAQERTSWVAGELLARDAPPRLTTEVQVRLRTFDGETTEKTIEARGLATPFEMNATSPVREITLDPYLRILRWTEAARRNRRQRTLLAQADAKEAAGELRSAIGLCRQALALDPSDLAHNQQQIHFELGRLRYRAGELEPAWREFGRALRPSSLDPPASDLYRAWAHVYRARIAQRQGKTTAAHAEARSGLALNSPALDTQVDWAKAPGQFDRARHELEALLR